MKPIEIWSELINSSNPEEELSLRLEEIYGNKRPFIAEIIMNSHCQSRCLHCIYSPDYAQYNKNMSWEEWRTAFHAIYNRLGLQRFIFDGRALTEECIKAIRLLKRDFQGVKVGLIADGISIEPFIEDLIDCPPDWLDVSVDGLEGDHDKQRNQTGAYRKTIDILIQLKESGAFEKINILTCLTALNIKSVNDMIRLLNHKGFKNFFITPVSILKEYRPDPGLQPKKEDFIQWLYELMEMAKGLSDSWVEVDIYDVLYASAIKQLRLDMFKVFKMDHEHLKLVRNYGDNEVHICYYPASLTGIRELIVNSDGNIIPPKVMAMGKIPRELIMGNILSLHDGRNIFHKLLNEKVYNMFTKELIEERQLLKPLTPFSIKKHGVMAN